MSATIHSQMARTAILSRLRAQILRAHTLAHTHTPTHTDTAYDAEPRENTFGSRKVRSHLLMPDFTSVPIYHAHVPSAALPDKFPENIFTENTPPRVAGGREETRARVVQIARFFLTAKIPRRHHTSRQVYNKRGRLREGNSTRTQPFLRNAAAKVLINDEWFANADVCKF